MYWRHCDRLLKTISSRPQCAPKFPNALRYPQSLIPRPLSDGKGFLLPDRLLVFHAGTSRIVFIACMKLTTIFLFSFSCCAIAPAYLKAPEQPQWAPAAAMVCGAIPMAFTLYFYAPFVSYVHLKLPRYARQSRELALKWVQTVPRDTEVDLTTIRFSGRSRVQRLPLSALRRSTARLGVVNMSANWTNTRRPWWKSKPLTEFHVGDERSRRWENQMWKCLWDQIPSNTK